VTRAPTLQVRLALTFQGVCVSAIGLYGLLRVVQAFVLEAPTPAAIVQSAHAGYFWRLWTVGYAGIMAGFVVFAATKRYESEVCRALPWALYVASALILLQGLFVP
jgi:hypothetical protein